jgi:hypothetical protein
MIFSIKKIIFGTIKVKKKIHLFNAARKKPPVIVMLPTAPKLLRPATFKPVVLRLPTFALPVAASIVTLPTVKPFLTLKFLVAIFKSS